MPHIIAMQKCSESLAFYEVAPVARAQGARALDRAPSHLGTVRPALVDAFAGTHNLRHVHQKKHPGSAPLDPEARDALSAVVKREGSVRAAARALDLPPVSLWRGLGSRPMRPSSHALVREALKKHTAQTSV